MSTRNSYTGFDLDRISSKLKSFHLKVNDYDMVTPTLARVVLSMTGNYNDRFELKTAIAKLFNNLASPVENSFRWANRNGDIKSVVGYVRSNNEVREFNDKQDSQKYRAVASNLLMDNEDKTLWEVKSGSNDSKYLTRKGNEDLSELVHLATSYRTASPKLTQLASAAPAAKEVVGFVDRTTEEMRYGFVVESGVQAKGKVTVVATDNDEAVDVPEEDVVDVYELDPEESAQLSTTAANGLSKEAMIEYYKKAYSYSPEYIQEIIKMIEQHAFA